MKSVGFLSRSLLLSAFLYPTSSQAYLASAPPQQVVLVLPAPYLDAASYSKLLGKLQKSFGDQAFVKGVNMPKTYGHDYDPQKEIAEALSQFYIQNAQGSDGKSVLLVGHSWGGHAVQNFISKHQDAQFNGWQIAGGILMGSSIHRNLIQIQKDGKSFINLGDSGIPIMVLGGELDGLNRVSRLAESYFHTDLNINAEQKSKFSTVLLRGMNHGQYADTDSKYPDFITKNDIKAEKSQDENLDAIVAAISSKFVLGADGDVKLDNFRADTDAVMAPFIEAMTEEGYYQMKPPCYSSDMVNPDDPTCLSGSPFVSKIAHNMMADDKHFKNPNVKLHNFDQFHRASTVVPVHHPVIDGNCTLEDADCTIKTYTITENYYVEKNDFNKLDRFQCAAWDMRSKLKSRQSLRMASGEKDADFHTYDEIGNRCAEINQAALDWALGAVDPQIKDRYEKHGQKLVMVDDRNTINGGLWIYAWMTYTESADKSQMQASSYAYRMGEDFPVKAFAGDHYCKILSPFKAMEWIAVDSLYAKYQAFEKEEATSDLEGFLI